MNIKNQNRTGNNLTNKITTFKDFVIYIRQNKFITKTEIEICKLITGEKLTNKNEIIRVLTDFVKAPNKSLLLNIFTLYGRIINETINVNRRLVQLNESEQIKHIKNLNESEENLLLKQEVYEPMIDEINDKNIGKVLDDSKYQFKFESGFAMESINSDRLSDIKFSLKWHKNNTKNYSEFLQSVKEFLKSADVTLTESDLNRLQKHYNRY